MPITYHSANREIPPSPTKRWQTTTQSSLDDVAKQLQGNYDHGNRIQGLRDRKLANTKTSISFGNEKVFFKSRIIKYFILYIFLGQVNYISDTKESLLKCTGKISPEEIKFQNEKIKEMKKELTTTNFRLGDEKPNYQSVNHESMARANNFRNTEKATLNTEVKENVKKSSLYFGNEKVNYESVSHNAMKYQGNQNNFQKLKEEVQDLTANLRKHNFTFGDEKVLYESDYQRGYGSIPKESYAIDENKKKHMKSFVDDCRSCHFTLGNDRPHYLSNTHSALKIIEGHSANDITAQIERAKEMRQALQKTSIIIGDDQEYF